MFKSNEDCVSYLYSMKWNKDFRCRTCENSSFYSGRTKWYRKCTKCGFDESATSNTFFHGMKVPLLKAFEIIFQLSLRKKGMSALEISRTFDVNKDTAALLKRKIQYASSKMYNLLFFNRKITQSMSRKGEKALLLKDWDNAVAESFSKQ